MTNVLSRINWVKSDTTIAFESITPQIAERMADYRNMYDYSSAKAVKTYMLGYEANMYYSNQKSIEGYKAKLDTCKTEKLIKAYKKDIKSAEERQKKYLKNYEEINDYSFKDVKKITIENIEARIDEVQGSANKMLFWYIFFIVMIPLYIIAERPYGYTISRYRTEAKMLSGIKKIAKFISGGLLGASSALYFTDVVTTWSSGRVTREDNGTGPAILAMKVALFVAAVAVICLTSCVLMTYSTIMGLYRNYPWSEWIAKAKEKNA